MKAVVPPPPAGAEKLKFAPLPDHTQLPDGESPGKGFVRPPDHTQLPDKDGGFVKNAYEPLQSHLLTDSVLPVLQRLRPDGDFFIGEDCGIYWRLTEPPERGVKAPDWFCVLGVPRLLDGQVRRSYVQWQEVIAPLMVLEYVSGDGVEERDRTPHEGKFWVYENAIHATFYGIYDANQSRLDVFHRVDERLQPLAANSHGRFPFAPLGIELGVWRGFFSGYELPWLRWWDATGRPLPTGDEERQRADRLAAQLRALGVEPVS